MVWDDFQKYSIVASYITDQLDVLSFSKKPFSFISALSVEHSSKGHIDKYNITTAIESNPVTYEPLGKHPEHTL